MKYIIYGKPNCKFCNMAKMTLEMKSVPYSYKEVGSDITKEQLEEMVGHQIKSVPQIFRMSDGFAEYIGGYEDLKKIMS